MINFIFTRDKLIIGAKAASSDIFQLKGKLYIPLDNRTMAETLRAEMPAIIQVYSQYAANKGMTINGSYLASVVYPAETDSNELVKLFHFLFSYTQVKIDLLYVGTLMEAYLLGYKQRNKVDVQSCIILEALDGYLGGLYFAHTKQIKSLSYIAFPKSDEAIGDHQEIPALNNKAFLAQIINPNSLKRLNIKHLILLGVHFKKQEFVDFFEQNLVADHHIHTHRHFSSIQIFKTIIDGLTIQKERKSNNLIRHTPIGKDEKININKVPKTMIADQAHLDFLKTTKQKEKEEWEKLAQMEIALKRRETQEKKRFEEIKEQLKIHKEGSSQLAQKEWNLLKIKENYRIIDEFHHTEFKTYHVMSHKLKTHQVMRVISHREFAQADTKERFFSLHRKESRYYSQISEIFEAVEGLFYLREYIYGISLIEYMDKIGLNQTKAFEKYSSKDLQLIISILEKIKSLSSTNIYDHINENNVLIKERRSWNLQYGLSIHIVGFRSTTCTNEQMTRGVYQMFNRLLSPDNFQAFRHTLKL